MLSSTLLLLLATSCPAAQDAEESPADEGAEVSVDGSAAMADLEAFAEELNQVGKLYLEVIANNEQLFLAGRVEQANQRILELVPREERGRAHEFLLGNWLFDLAPEISYECHRRAWLLSPENPVVIAEFATELHRRREHSAALARYDDYVARLEELVPGSSPPHVHALRAECLLYLQRHAEAVDAWERADVAQNAAALELGLARVHGDPSPWTKRAKLLSRIAAGELEQLERLIQLDLRWFEGGGTLDVNEKALVRDLALADELLTGDGTRRAALDLQVEIGRALLPQILGPRYQGEVAVLSATILVRRMTALGLWGEGARLPASSFLANLIFDYGVRMGAFELAQLRAAFEAPLRERAFSEVGDEEACGILAVLYRDGGDLQKVEEIERLGWQRYRDWQAAFGVLARKRQTLVARDPDLGAALRAFPLEPEIQRVGMFIAQNGPSDERLAALTALTLAELDGVPSLREMPDYFEVMRMELESGE